jgi:hypothetical protein
MLPQYSERLEASPRSPYYGLWLGLTVFFAIHLGFQLGGYRYGHGDPQEVALNASMLLVGASNLVNQRWLRLGLLSGSAVGLAIALTLLVRLRSYETLAFVALIGGFMLVIVLKLRGNRSI